MCDGTDGTPDLTDRFLEGTLINPGIYKEPGLPNITGTGGFGPPSSRYYSGAFVYPPSGYGHFYTTGTGELHMLEFSASNSNRIYGNSVTVQPNAYTVYYIIKVK